MRKLLNTLFVLTEDSYLALEGENVLVLREEETLARYPLHTIESILYFGYKGASPALMGACAEAGIPLCFLTPQGRFLCRVTGEIRGNVILRELQFRIAAQEQSRCGIARCMIAGKLYNAKWVLERAVRDHAIRVDADSLCKASDYIAESLRRVTETENEDELRGVEGEAAARYFAVFDELVLQNKDVFFFRGRSRRPPLDALNALLSFSYTLLANDCSAALESAGLDPYVGFMHGIRSGRASLSLDLMEELRPCFADRFVVSCVNNRIMQPKHFQTVESGAVLMTEEGRRAFLTAWQERKREEIKHPFLGEKIAWGLVPYVQALLLARSLRGDMDVYPPFLWK